MVREAVEADQMRWEETAVRIRKRDGVCRRCLRKADDVHHILPRRFGGADHPVNLILLCDPCHLEVENIFRTIGLTKYMRRWMVENRFMFDRTRGGWPSRKRKPVGRPRR